MTSFVADLIGSEPRIRKTRTRSPVILDKGEVRWRPGHEPGKTTVIPEEMAARMFGGLPPEVRRTPREHFEYLLQMLITDARNMFLRDGVVHWPASIKRELQAIGWKEGKPDMWAEVEMLARKYVVETANRQKEADRRRVTRP